jgi:proline iminopeptidase
MVPRVKNDVTTDDGAAPSAPATGQSAHHPPTGIRAQATSAGRLRAVSGPAWRDWRIAAATARRLDGDIPAPKRWWSRSGLWTRRVITVLLVVGLLGLTAVILRPASTEQLLGDDGRHGSGGGAELTRGAVGGHDLAMMIRGADVRNPVLLYLAGGSGGTDIAAMRRHGQLLEEDFTVATFDQSGAGTSADSLEPAATLTLDRAVSDAIVVTD